MEFVNNRYPSQLIRSKGYIWFSDASKDDIIVELEKCLDERAFA